MAIGDNVTDELKAKIDTLLRSLRQCDDQASAIKWMANAYDAMDGALRVIADLERRIKEEAAEAKGLIFYVPPRKIEVVQAIPRYFAKKSNDIPNYTRPSGQTVVYPEFFLHPGLKPAPKPWTMVDQRKISNAENWRRPAIVRKGR